MATYALREDLGVLTTEDGRTQASVVDRCRAGDAAAWEEIVRAETRRIYGICYRFTGSAQDAEDLAQEVFIKAYRNLGRYDPGKATLGTWIAAIARNALVDHLRRTKDHRRTESLDRRREPEETGPDTRDVEDEAPGPHERLQTRDTQRRVQEALLRLSPEFREAVILRDLQDMDYSEIAAVLNLPEGTVKSRISRGRAELARVLARIYPQVPSK